MAEKRVLFLDVATTTGFAVDAPSGGDKPLTGAFRCAHSDDDLGQAFAALDQHLRDLITVHAPDVLAFEAAFPFQGKRGSTRPTNFQTVRKTLGLVAIVEKCGWNAALDVFECNIQAIRNHFTGNGRAEKPEVWHRCKVLGWDVKTLDASDAAAGWDFAKSTLRSMAVRGAA